MKTWIYWRGSLNDSATEIKEYLASIRKFTGRVEITGFLQETSSSPWLSRECVQLVLKAAKNTGYDLLVTDAMEYCGEARRAQEPIVNIVGRRGIRIWAKGYGLLPLEPDEVEVQ